jgi:hypothetical protein
MTTSNGHNNDFEHVDQTATPDDSEVEVSPHPIVTIVIGAYNRPRQLAVLLHCLQVQTLEAWEAIVVHETPSAEVRQVVASLADRRVKYLEIPARVRDWGNTCKETGTAIAAGEWIGHSNDDNYYAPEYMRMMVDAAVKQEADFVYCDMVHSHQQYRVLETAPVVGRIDCGGWLCRAGIVKATVWPAPKSDPQADGHYVERLLQKCRGVIKVKAVLFVHN